MADSKISALSSGAPAQAGDEYVVARSGANYKLSLTDIAASMPNTVISVNTSTDALRITQVGSGNALVVEDSANPDATPTVITATGNLGIGTTSPAVKLDVVGAVSATGNITSGGILQALGTVQSSSGADLSLNANGANRDVFLKVNGTTLMTVQGSTGNVGIGTTSPATKLTINQNNSDAVLIRNADTNYSSLAFGVSTTSGFTYLQSTNSGSGTIQPLAFWVGASERARIDADGQFLLGTTSTTPITGFSGTAKGITVQSSYPAIALVDSDDTTNFISWLVNSGGNLYLFNKNSTSPLIFGTNNAERARITAGGYFKASNDGTYVGSTSNYHEFRSTNNTYAVYISNTNASPLGTVIEYNNASPNGTGNQFLYCGDSTALRAEIRSNGGIANYSANNVALSDARTKNSIAPAASMWGKIGALEIVTYKYNDQTHDDVNLGVIAQQVESVEPVWVDAEGFGNTPEGEEPLKTVYTTDITFAAIKALQEAMARIEQLEAKVAQLEAR